MKTHTVVFYRQYGKWSCTMPFERRRDAERHADTYLRRPEKDYIKDITFIDVQLPE